MPNVVGTVRGFIREFHPERVRVVFLSPTRDGEQQKGLFSGSNWSRNLQRIPGVEVACIDARWKRKNGLLLADFFDFT
ncbi:MAG: hypothetical protein EYC70_07020 [Planctomycetota bacterium]|nr:MAG: hypothetical protein EYC70_07020 [Planctomycetota bacterium]